VPVFRVYWKYDSVSPAIEQAIGIDNQAAAYAMTEWLIKKGHRKNCLFRA